MSAGKLIKKKRREKKLTLLQVAEHLGVSESMMSRIENETRVPKTHAKKLSKLLDIPEREIHLLSLVDEIVRQFGKRNHICLALDMAIEAIKKQDEKKEK